MPGGGAVPTCVCIAFAQIPTWSAVLHGGIGGLVYTFASSRVLKAKIDDPLDAFAVHGACGMWGVLAASLFSSNKYSKGGRAGLFYGDGEMFGAALVFLICVIAWSASLSLAVFTILSKMKMLRTNMLSGGHRVEERLDDSTHNTQPYIPHVKNGTPGSQPCAQSTTTSSPN
uniref:Ammonium transporter AmtB-like domain-containing protein n=1 Tax=Haptolina ericina TaxID=156174 RepID=A0A7S3AMC0_9EUKA|mmetsp:Transcript_22775/g.51534  ORF Transcript_22775/g.51534 Transcript_22775/m.51534 type:complete len:172 (+) Transcript_22775:46-561(+)